MVGELWPAPRARRLVVERRKDERWQRIAHVRTSASGRYRAQLAAPGVYRVRGAGVAGPAVRVR